VPRYDYRCSKGHRYEKQEPFGSPSQHKCEKCGAVAKRQISVPALAFKGSGFYVTDSRKSGESGGSSSSSSSNSSSSSSTSDSSDSSSSSDSSKKSSKKKSD
jgi:putative FmdB family regulatory protein